MDEEKIGKELVTRMTLDSLEYYKGSQKMNLEKICCIHVLEFIPNGDDNEYNYTVTGVGEFHEKGSNDKPDINNTSEGPMRFEMEIKIECDEIISINKRVSIYPMHPSY